MQVIFSAEVRIKLIEIYEYYEALPRADYGHKIRAALINKSLKLKGFPRLGQVEENLIGLGLGHRYLVEKNYKIIYSNPDLRTILELAPLKFHLTIVRTVFRHRFTQISQITGSQFFMKCNL